MFLPPNPPGNAPPQAGAPPPGASAPQLGAYRPPGAQEFLPSSATTGGVMAQNPGSQTPQNQDDSQVTPEEQRQYDDFVTRAKLFISDPRVPLNSKGHPQPNGKAPRDVIIDHLNAVGGQAAAMAVGRTAAQVVTLITNNAQHQGFPYPPDVIFHGSDEIISDLYQIGVAAGVIKNPPPENSDAEAHLLGMAKMYGAQFYGKNLIDSGQDTPELQQQAHQYITQQMQREADSGALDKWDPGYQMTPQRLTTVVQNIAQGNARQLPQRPPQTIAQHADAGHPQMVPPSSAPGGAPAPDQGDGGDQSGDPSQQQAPDDGGQQQ